MNSYQQDQPLANNHISVDCVVIGFDGEQLKVLLIKREGVEDGQAYHDMKLPGSLIYRDEDLDEAARRVLGELTGFKSVNLMQFKAFGSKDRTKDPRDIHWLERAQKAHVELIVTVGYLALVKIGNTPDKSLEEHQACWVPVDEVPDLAFDHNLIISEAMTTIRRVADSNPAMIFDLLARKFTASQLRTLFERIYQKDIDVRNFHKKITMTDYVVPLDEYEHGVAHRAARYYKFDRKIYNRNRR